MQNQVCTNIENGDKITISNVEEKRYKIGNLLIIACFFLYMASMAVKAIFVAEMKFIQTLWELTYAKVSLANTFYFVPYGIVQLLMFVFMRKINMRKFMIVTIPLAALCGILMGTTNKIEWMWIYFGLTGIFQASIYCGCIEMLAVYLPAKLITKANKFMASAFAIGSFISYALCALCIFFGAWRIPYFALGGMFTIAVVMFIIVVNKAKRYRKINQLLDKKEKEATINQNNQKPFEDNPILHLHTKKRKTIFYVVDILISFLVTALYYCVMNYISSLLVDEYGVNQDISIYISMLAPFAILFGPILAINSCNKNRNFIAQIIKFLLFALPCPLLLAFFYGANMFVALLFILVFIVMVKGAMEIILSIINFKNSTSCNIAKP